MEDIYFARLLWYGDKRVYGEYLVMKKILVVDDDRDFLESLQLVIFEQGHRVYTVSDGYSAIEQYKTFKPDIVFLDIKMPGIDGYETFIQIRKHDPGAQIILMSGYVLDVVRYTDVEKSAAGIINKPILFDDLKDVINKHLKRT